MATKNGNGSAQEALAFVCPLCRDTFKTPKILPCFHTFCEGCLSNLVDRNRTDTFLCPSCRREIQVPPGGVPAFQNNFYIPSTYVEKAEKKSSPCPKHPDRQAELYCVEHDVLVCVNCFVRDHNQHASDNISGVEERFKAQLTQDRERLQRSLENVNSHLEEATRDRQALQDKKTVVENDIHNRHAMITAAADKYRDEALSNLSTVTAEIEMKQEAEIRKTQQNLEELTKLQQRVRQTVDSGAGCELMTVAREMRCGRGSEEAVQKLTTKQMTTVCRPVLRFNPSPELTFQRMRDYIGSVAKMDMAVSAPEVTVAEQFRNGNDPDTEVYCVCPLDDGRVILSYINDLPSQEFNNEGDQIAMHGDLKGIVSWKNMRGGNSLHQVRAEGKMVCTYAKSEKLYRLNSYGAGEGDVRREVVVSDNPLKTEQKSEILINCGTHRAFDADSDVQLFVVLEEPSAPDLHRRVRLYRRSQPDAIATYSPPVTPFQPSDVCFYTLGGHEVLLVADELNDAIHVVNVQDGRLSFARYLAPGCPLLVQPTALNTDTRGRLWVACRGGRIITCTPASEEVIPKR
ncbi:hypothetical protein BaRGS_00027184 [Batillaria attramentaria]|uniref:Uncharacterized protein n=1 Tax=Batillaria attramentaria TaxID=370345 RepID=A0ABD0K299_9CAEN